MKKAILLLLTLGALAPLIAQADDHWNNRDDWRRNEWRWHHRHHHDWDDYNHEDWHHHHHYHHGDIIVVPD